MQFFITENQGIILRDTYNAWTDRTIIEEHKLFEDLEGVAFFVFNFLWEGGVNFGDGSLIRETDGGALLGEMVFDGVEGVLCGDGLMFNAYSWVLSLPVH